MEIKGEVSLNIFNKRNMVYEPIIEPFKLLIT